MSSFSLKEEKICYKMPYLKVANGGVLQLTVICTCQEA